jgi:hypothetical protein
MNEGLIPWMDGWMDVWMNASEFDHIVKENLSRMNETHMDEKVCHMDEISI